MVKRRLGLVLIACALMSSTLVPAAAAGAAAKPAATCEKQLTTSRVHHLTFPYNTPGAQSWMQMTGTTTVCWDANGVPSLVSSNKDCRALHITRKAKVGPTLVVGTQVGGDKHAIKIKLTCRALIPNFKGRYSVYKVHQYQTVSLGAWFKQPYVVSVTHQHVQSR